MACSWRSPPEALRSRCPLTKPTNSRPWRPSTTSPYPPKKVIRAAISAHSAERKKDEVFQQGLRARIERAQRMLDECQP